MRDLNIAIRSLFKRGRHNVTKIVSLSIGLAIGLVLIAKIYFEQSYDSFYPNADRIYRLTGYTSNENESKVSESVSAIVAPTMKEEVPGIEAATRLTRRHARNPASGHRPDATKTHRPPSPAKCRRRPIGIFPETYKGSAYRRSQYPEHDRHVGDPRFRAAVHGRDELYPDRDLGDREP